MQMKRKHGVRPSRNGAAESVATKLDRHVRSEEAKGAYKHYADPAEFVDELKTRSKSTRHALRTAAA